MPMIATTINNSMRVKPFLHDFIGSFIFISCYVQIVKNLFKKLFSALSTDTSKLFTPELNKKLIYLKGILFLIIGIVGFLYCLLLNFSIFFFFMLVLTIWAWCRLYYFMFYVITKYVDPDYKFSSIFNFLQYLMRKKWSCFLWLLYFSPVFPFLW
jgi:hypothetical protein